MKRLFLAAPLAFIAAFLCCPSAATANFIQDPDPANEAGWTFHNATGATSNVGSGAISGCVGSACVNQDDLADASYISQTITGLTDGEQLILSFFLNPDIGTYSSVAPNETKVVWDGAVVFDGIDISPAGWYTITISGLIANGGADDLTVLLENTPGATIVTGFDLEDASPSAPEPGTAALLLFSVTAGLIIRRLRIG